MASVVAVAVLTYLHIVIGEMVPKALALQRADKTVLYVSPLISGLQHAILPLVVALNGVGNRLLRLAGIERREVDASVITRPRSSSSSSARARKAGSCVASPGRFCATCSSSAIGPPVR